MDTTGPREALVPLDMLPNIFGVHRMTIHRWLDADDIERHTFTEGKAVRWGDIEDASIRSTRWARPAPKK